MPTVPTVACDVSDHVLPRHADRSAVRIGLFWHGGTYANLGVGALTWANVALLARAARQARVPVRFTMFVTGEPGLDRLDPLDVDLEVVPVPVPTKPSWVPSAFVRLRRALRDQDIVVDISAGDSFASIYGTSVLFRQTFTKVATLSAGKPLVLAPQTLGPFSPFGKFVSRGVTRSAVTFIRDAESAEAVSSRTRGAVERVADVAFALDPVPFDQTPSPAKRIGLNVSGLLWHARPADRYYVEGYRPFVRGLLDHLTASTDTTVHLVPHVVSMQPGHSDEDYALAELLAADYPSDLVLPARFVTPGEAKGYIGTLDALFTSRMHAAIAAVSSGVPAIAVSYSPKFDRTFRAVGYPVPIIDLRALAPQAAIDAAIGHLGNLQSLAADAVQARERAAILLDTYVDRLALILTGVAARRGG